MENRTKILVATAVILASYAFGRFSTPDHVKIETKIVEVEKKTTDTELNKDKHKETTTVEITKPDGTKEKTTKTVEDTKTDKTTKSTEETDRTEESSKEVSRGSKVTLAALGGVSLNLTGTSPILYGGILTKPVLGPITIGVWGLSNATTGLAVGLTF